jgi:hypothetical protein
MTTMNPNPTPPYAPTKPYKALLGLVLALLSTLATAYVSRHHISVDEVITAIVGTLITAAGVYGITNPPK